jgi:hypothetical protein
VASEFMINTKVKYDKAFAGPSEVPFPNYRCKATCIKPARIDPKTGESFPLSVSTQHNCKIVIDHDQTNHFCICGLEWPNSNKKEKVS